MLIFQSLAPIFYSIRQNFHKSAQHPIFFLFGAKIPVTALSTELQ